MSIQQLDRAVRDEVGRLVIGQDPVISSIVLALAARGHVLLEGVPGVAKTLIATAISRVLGLQAARVQFTPDMLPSDLTGTMTLRGGELSFRRGPVFTNVLVADEINRTPPKTQAALLEAMQEGQVSVEGEAEPLPDPFCVVATQNPIEYEGTYPLPEAQLDRFLMMISVGYPDEGAERAILGLERTGVEPAGLERLETVAGAAELGAAREELDETTVADEVAGYVVDLVRRTRELPSVELGASPRAAVHLLAAARGAARLAGRDFVIPDDVVEVAPRVLAHRLVLSPEAALERFSREDAVGAALAAVPVPK